MRVPRSKFFLAALAVTVISVFAGWIFSPTASTYLKLQQGSDQLHRDVLLAEALCALGFLVFGITAIIFSHYKTARWVLGAICTTCIAIGLGLGAYVVHHDMLLERKGTAGQLVKDTDIPSSWAEPGAWRTFREEGVPGISGTPAADGTRLELDRIGLVLRDTAGRAIWNRRRPGGWPAVVLESNRAVIIVAHSDRFEDDIVIQAIERRSGRLVYGLHALGRRTGGVAASGRKVAVLLKRVAVARLYVFPLDRPEDAWSLPIDVSATLEGFAGGEKLRLRAGGKEFFVDIRGRDGG